MGAFLSFETLSIDVNADDTLVFASDYHDISANLSTVITACKNIPCELIGIVGDYQSTSDDDDVRALRDNSEFSSLKLVLTQGNHDTSATIGYDSLSRLILDEDGEVDPVSRLNNDNQYYDIYVVNVSNFTNADTELDRYLQAHTNGKTVLILGHYPLHSTRISGTDDDAIFNVLQKWGPYRDIVYLWGHNHSMPFWDNGVDYTVVPTGVIGGNAAVVNANATVPLNFTYLNAGYLNPQAGVAGPSWTVLTLSDTNITIKRFKNGVQSGDTLTVARKPNI